MRGKLGLPNAGKLLGLLHDLGKYSTEFQSYIQSATGILNPDEDAEFVDAEKLRGKVDHSSAGAQYLWKELAEKGALGQIVGQMLALCLASHHSGLLDCLSTSPSEGAKNAFRQRLDKGEAKSHLAEVLARTEVQRIRSLIEEPALIQEIQAALRSILKHAPEKNDKSAVVQFQIGLLVRFLFSCLIDADRQDTADFENPLAAQRRMHGAYVPWEELIGRLESQLQTFAPRHPIDRLRQEISRTCLNAAERERGLFTLTVPTGGGKTLASLRFALHHAAKHRLERIVYVIPFTTIIEQNAEVVRTILEPPTHPEDQGRVVLEHHSSLAPQRQDWRHKMLTEAWDAPIIFTTSVQFLDVFFGAGTRGARRMHQLTRALIVFDEIQSLPVRCVHLFNNAVNFLADQGGSSVLLCTATQPVLGRVNPQKGALRLGEDSEIIPQVQTLFEQLKRVTVLDQRKPGGWTNEEIAAQADVETELAGSCLVVVNTKKMAKELYRQLRDHRERFLYHLSTSMCPAHRKGILHAIREGLSNQQPVLCISTALIEAGVDVDFGSVIRCCAGLDSVAQAAGRCNRNGHRPKGDVLVVNPAAESLKHLDEIRIGRDNASRVLADFHHRPDLFDGDPIGPKAIAAYSGYTFFERQKEMDYPVTGVEIGRDDTLLNMLSCNQLAAKEFERQQGHKPDIYLKQAFRAAAEAFKAFDAPTQSVIVPYGAQGKEIIAALCGAFDAEKHGALLHRAQPFTVNLFPHEFESLKKQGGIHEIQEGLHIFYLREAFYSHDFGISTESVTEEELLNA